MNKKSFLILVAGGTCSGKNNTAGKLSENNKEPVILDTDDFYCNDTKFRTSEEVNYDFNKPENVEWSLLIHKVKKLLEGKDVCAPAVRGTAGDKQQIYEKGVRKIKFTRTDDKELKKSAPIIVVVGVHALQNEELRNLADLKVFMDTSIDLRLILKIKRSPYYKEIEGTPIRDVRDFGRPKSPETKGFQKFTESIMNAFDLWNTIVKPSEMEYVIPTKEYADLILESSTSEDFPKNTKIISDIVSLYFKNEVEFHQKLKEFRKKGGSEELKKEYSSQLQTKIEVLPK